MAGKKAKEQGSAVGDAVRGRRKWGGKPAATVTAETGVTTIEEPFLPEGRLDAAAAVREAAAKDGEEPGPERLHVFRSAGGPDPRSCAECHHPANDPIHATDAEIAAGAVGSPFVRELQEKAGDRVVNLGRRRLLKVRKPLDDAALASLARDMAGVRAEIQEVEEEKKRAVKDWNEQIETLDKRLGALALQVRTGASSAEVEVEEVLDFESNRVRHRHVGTGEILPELDRPMEPGDRQLAFEVAPEASPLDEEVADNGQPEAGDAPADAADQVAQEIADEAAEDRIPALDGPSSPIPLRGGGELPITDDDPPPPGGFPEARA